MPRHAATLDADVRQPVHYLSGSTLTDYPLVVLMPAEAYGDAICTDGTLPVACGVRLLLTSTPPECSVCGNAPAAFMVEGWEAEAMEGAACAVCVLGENGGYTLGIVRTESVEGVEA